MNNNSIKQLIKSVKIGMPEEVRTAQKEFKRIFDRKDLSSKQSAKLFEPFVEEIANFDQIIDTDHKYYFINILKYPFFILGEQHFEEWSAFVLELIQNPSGKIRQATINAADWLILMNLRLNKNDFFLRKPTAEYITRIERDRERFFNLVQSAERLLDKYYQPKFERYKYVSSLPVGIYKSIEKFMTECLMPSEYQENIYEEYCSSLEKKDLDDFEINLKKNANDFNAIIDCRSDTGIKFMTEYFDYHKYVPKNVEKLTDDDINGLFEILSDPKSSEIEQKKAIIILAHVGNRKSLKILEWYDTVAEDQFKFWVETGIGECKMFLDSPQSKL